MILYLENTDKFYIEWDVMKLQFIKSLYPKSVLIKSAYAFTDRAYIHLDENDDYYLVEVTVKNGNCLDTAEFINEMLAQSARYEVYKQTRDIRKLTVARAFASTLIKDEAIEGGLNDEESCDIDSVLEDWFETSE